MVDCCVGGDFVEPKLEFERAALLLQGVPVSGSSSGDIGRSGARGFVVFGCAVGQELVGIVRALQEVDLNVILDSLPSRRLPEPSALVRVWTLLERIMHGP